MIINILINLISHTVKFIKSNQARQMDSWLGGKDRHRGAADEPAALWRDFSDELLFLVITNLF